MREIAAARQGPAQIIALCSFTACRWIHPPYHVGGVITAYWPNDKKVWWSGAGLVSALAEGTKPICVVLGMSRVANAGVAVTNQHSAGA